MKMQEEGLFSLNKDLGKPQDEDKNCHRWTNYVIFLRANLFRQSNSLKIKEKTRANWHANCTLL